MTASFDGLLLIQLGTPAAATPSAVGKYLLDFLGDPHTLGNPPFFWKPLLRFGIVPLRSRSSAAKYRAMLDISHSSEMPLLTHTKAFAQGVAEKIGTRMKVAFAFQYGTGPSVSEALGAFAEQGLRNLCVIPLYPQRSSATSGAAIALVRKAAENFPDISLHFVDGFARSDAWARNVADSIYGKWNEKDDIVLSWHGLPESRILAGDPYKADCEASAALIEKHLNTKVISCYQSRFGFAKWIGPSTLDVLHDLGSRQRNVVLAAPAFTADNLETLYEIDTELKNEFLRAGGGTFVRVPCLNADPRWIRDFADFIVPRSSGAE